MTVEGLFPRAPTRALDERRWAPTPHTAGVHAVLAAHPGEFLFSVLVMAETEENVAASFYRYPREF